MSRRSRVDLRKYTSCSINDLEKLHTKTLKNIIDAARRSLSSSDDRMISGEFFKSVEMLYNNLKIVLKDRPHVLNKIESRALRVKKMKVKKFR